MRAALASLVIILNMCVKLWHHPERVRLLKRKKKKTKNRLLVPLGPTDTQVELLLHRPRRRD